MTSTDITFALRALAALRLQSGQTLRGQCIAAVANEIADLTDDELERVGIHSMEIA